MKSAGNSCKWTLKVFEKCLNLSLEKVCKPCHSLHEGDGINHIDICGLLWWPMTQHHCCGLVLNNCTTFPQTLTLCSKWSVLHNHKYPSYQLWKQTCPLTNTKPVSIRDNYVVKQAHILSRILSVSQAQLRSGVNNLSIAFM